MDLEAQTPLVRRPSMQALVAKQEPLVQIDPESPSYGTLSPRAESPSARDRSRLYDAALNVLAGAVVFLLSSTMAVSCASVVVGRDPALGAYLANVIDMNLLGTAIMGLFMCWRSHAPWAMAAIDVSVVPVLADMAHHITKELNKDMKQVVPTLFVTIAAASVSIGLCVYLVGKCRISSLSHYIPFPVITGFLAGIGGVLVKDGMHMAAQAPLTWTSDSITLVLPAVLFAFASHSADHARVPPTIYLPVLLVGSVLGFHAVVLAGGYDVGPWSFAWTPAMLAQTPRWYSWAAIEWRNVQWSVLLGALVRGLPTLLLLGALKYSVLVRSLSFLFDRDVPVDGEMKAIGLANVLSGVVGCTGGCHYISAMGLLGTFNAHPRAPVYVCAALLFLLWSVGLGSLVYMPKFVFGGLLLHIGVHFLLKYLVAPMRSLPGLECGVVVVVFLCFVTVGTLQSVGLGLVLSSVHLVFQLNAVGCVRSYHFSAPDGFAIHLQGYLCFATSKYLVRKIEKLWRTHRFGVLRLDFEHVLAVDNSFLRSFRQVEAFAKHRDLVIQLDRMPEAMAPLFPPPAATTTLVDAHAKRVRWVAFLLGPPATKAAMGRLVDTYRLERAVEFLELRVLPSGGPFPPGLGRWWFLCDGAGSVDDHMVIAGTVLEGSRMSAAFVASTPCTLLHLSEASWKALHLQSPELAIGVLEAIHLLHGQL
ncbi:Sulfate Permease (SulP) Family [Achlya hypogyna]|uniref:Sulfate Permease (SulP) Family n=1 Tax=Achlya hypogyna TaxID=1202772 RepID=A0A1V9ZAD9_ACHHY|nr:Sulfate Permease (SulP) Family [Achlya hypogyna]